MFVSTFIFMGERKRRRERERKRRERESGGERRKTLIRVNDDTRKNRERMKEKIWSLEKELHKVVRTRNSTSKSEVLMEREDEKEILVGRMREGKK